MAVDFFLFRDTILKTMRIVIKGTQLEITDSLKKYINDRFSALDKLIEVFEQNRALVLRVEAARTTQHHRKGAKLYYVECMVDISGKTVRIEQYGDDIRVAIDEAQNRLKRELRRIKERTQEKHPTKRRPLKRG